MIDLIYEGHVAITTATIQLFRNPFSIGKGYQHHGFEAFFFFLPIV